MSQDMNKAQGNSYRYLANSPSRSSSRLTTLKGYLTSTVGYSTPSPGSRGGSSQDLSENNRQGWRSWAGEKARKLGPGVWRSSGGNEPSDNIENVTLFPGWAARRYKKEITGSANSQRPFEVEVFTSGYTISYKNRHNISRSQRAFIRVAKGFAALPKLTSYPTSDRPEPVPLSKSTEELLSQIHLPPRPEEITDGYDMDSLDRQFRRAQLESTAAGGTVPPSNTGDSDSSSLSSAASSTNDLVSALKTAEERLGVASPAPTTSSTASNSSFTRTSATETASETIRRMHANLEARLQPFWSSVLANRTVRLHLFVSPHHDPTSLPQSSTLFQARDDQLRPLASVDVTTASDGSFHAKFVLKWEDLCHHATTRQIAYGEDIEEHTLVVVAELLKPQPLYATAQDSSSYAQYQSLRRLQNQESTRCQAEIPITHCPIRVVSDIDDTVKDSGVLNGARAVFHNVFVKDLGDCVVAGMGEWYTDMWHKGIRFHYVSNGPFEYLSVLKEFFPLSQLPPGSIKLRSFAGRSLFNGFFSAPAAKKRAGVEDIIKAFPDSQFFLIGDSGEQDLELYAELSQSYANSILGVFIRDVSTKVGVTDPLDDPTGWNAIAIVATNQHAETHLPSAVSEIGEHSSSTGHQRSPIPAHSRRSMTDILVGAGRRSSNSLTSFLSLDKGSKDSAPANDGPCFVSSSNAPLSREPVDDAVPSRRTTGSDHDDGSTPQLGALPVMENSQTITSNSKEEVLRDSSSSRSGVSTQWPIITEPPRPIPHPSLHRSSVPTGANTPPVPIRRQSFRSQQTGESSSASSDADGDRNFSKVSMASGLMLPTSGVSLEERRRNELQMRVWRARTIMPGHVKLRIFRQASECVEVNEILGE